MVFAIGVACELRTVEIDITQVASCVASGFVIEVACAGMPAFAAGSYSTRVDVGAKFHHRDKAVSTASIPFLGVGVLARAERG